MKVSLVIFGILFWFVAGCSADRKQTVSSNHKSDILHSAIIPVPNPEKSIQDWWLPRHKTINEQLTKGTVDLLFVGNSIINGFEDTGKDIWNIYYAPRNALNMGFGWDRTQHVLWRLKNSNLQNIAPKLVILLIGTNNIGRNSAAEIVDGITTICTVLKNELPTARILLLGILPRFKETSPDRKIIKQINTSIARLDDQKKVFFLDIGQTFVDQNNRISKDIMQDMLHPTARGYELFAKAIEPSVKRLMEM